MSGWTESDFGISGARLFSWSDVGVRVSVTNWGATVTSIETPDSAGQWEHVAFGFDDCRDYQSDRNRFFGCTVGRYANRIRGGQFSLNGITYKLPVNNGSNCLHGGLAGFDKKMWTASIEGSEVVMRYTSVDGEEGFPGTLEVVVKFSVDGTGCALRIEYEAVAVKGDTVLNLTNHSYFNLDGCAKAPVTSIEDHSLQLLCHKYGAVESDGIPKSELEPIVPGSPFDFSSMKRIGLQINSEDDEQLRLQKGYDHSFLITEPVDGLKPRLAAVARGAHSGREMRVFTTEPFVHFYSGNYLSPAYGGRGQVSFAPRSGFCLETQHLADSPNRDDSTTLKEGQKMNSVTVFHFSISKTN